MKINEIEINEKQFAYDGCHKIYLLEDKNDIKEAKKLKYNIYDIEHLKTIYQNSCCLRFISNWKLDKKYANQFEDAYISC